MIGSYPYTTTLTVGPTVMLVTCGSGSRRLMKPLLSEERDDETLQNLGRASLQIIHDIKNQLNGLKLYATFLRKRMEKGGQPADEQETVAKLVAGLERAANDLTVLVQYSCPIEIHKKYGVDIQNYMISH